MTTISFPEAEARIRAAIDAGILTRLQWGDGTHTVCMMSAIVPGARSHGDCVTAGWPRWLVDLNVTLFDAQVGADDESAARQHFALDVAKAVATPRDMDRARDLFLIARLDTGEHSALATLRSLPSKWPEQIAAIERVVELLQQRLNGEDVAEEMRVAREAAYNAADVATDSVVNATYAAAYAASDAPDATHAATDATYAAAYAAVDAANAAVDAANAAARHDLIAALNEKENGA